MGGGNKGTYICPECNELLQLARHAELAWAWATAMAKRPALLWTNGADALYCRERCEDESALTK